MHKALIALTAIVAATAPAAAERLSPDARLSRVTEGRVAGEPVNCIDTRRFNSTQIIDGTAIVYGGAGETLYVNQPRAGENSLDRFDVLVTRSHGTQLCRGDVVRVVEPNSFIQTGVVFLGDFVPYRRDSRD